MRRFFLPSAAVLVGMGAIFAFTGWNREVAPGLLVAGLVYAVAALVVARRRPP